MRVARIIAMLFKNRCVSATLLLLATSNVGAGCGRKPCAADRAGCKCDLGSCQLPLVCELSNNTCREPHTCAELSCSDHQVCEAGGPQKDAVCVGSCEPGFVWNDKSESCEQGLPTCDPVPPTSILADCQQQNRDCIDSQVGALCGGCATGYVDEAGSCRATLDCAELQCTQRLRACDAGSDHRDASCGECLTGTVEVDGICKLLTCGPVVSADEVLADCYANNRECATGAVGAECGGCLAGFLEEMGGCRTVQTCDTLACSTAGRLCEPAGDHTDGRCGACRAGYTEVSGTCEPTPQSVCDPAPAAGSILADCLAEKRQCVNDAAGAYCGDCVSGYSWNASTGACEQKKTCAQLDCGALNRACSDDPQGHCTECLSGFVDDPTKDACRAVVTCADLSCPDGTRCVEGASVTGDAACQQDCGADAIWSGLRCEPCPPCDGPGEIGRWPVPTRAGNCICETEPGYFYYVGGDIGTQRCDRDGDGWVRQSARTSIEGGDPALEANARCDLRYIDRFILVNESGEEYEHLLRDPLALYESVRNDDAGILAAEWQALGLPPTYGSGTGARLPRPEELNRLTKLCHDVRTDYNDNGVFDVIEFGAQEPAPVLSPDQIPFNEFSYFMELDRGWYEPPTSSGGYGSYRIVERPRPADPALAATATEVPLLYDPADGNRWRTCERERDADWDNIDVLPVGMDLATYYTPPANPYEIPNDYWRGMMHHSQFKCLVLSSSPDAKVPTMLRPQDVSADGYRINRCTISGDGAQAGSTAANPWDPPLGCQLVSATDASLTAGAVAWGLVPYLDHGPWDTTKAPVPYERGCRNGCYAALSSCTGYNVNPDSVWCDYDLANFGKFIDCGVQEICDGIDNDGNGQTDESDPRVGNSCEPDGLLGVCKDGGGLMTCQSTDPYLVCEPQVLPAPQELCNLKDDDCDGEVDEGDPGNDGAQCALDDAALNDAGLDPQYHNGECLYGSRGACIEGKNLCQVSYTRQAEICNNGKDDDCDGKVDENEMRYDGGQDELAALGATKQPGCIPYYRDADGDGWGALLQELCLCDAGTQVKVYNPNDTSSNDPDTQTNPYIYVKPKDSSDPDDLPDFDCCDANNTVYPEAPGWTTTAKSGCAMGFDVNCDGNQTQRWTTTGQDGCSTVNVWEGPRTCWGTHCSVPVAGWLNSVAVCGQTATYIAGSCNCSGAECRKNHFQRTQECK